jgi:hypothetical protein
MIAILRAIGARIARAGSRLRGAAGRHAVATGLSLALGTGAAGLGGGVVLADHVATPVAAAPAPTAPATPPSCPSPGAKPGSALHRAAAEAARRLIALTAKQTGKTPAQVMALLRQGQTLEQIAGSDASQVVAAADAAAQAKLAGLVSAGKLSAAQESTVLTRLESAITTAMTTPGPTLARLAEQGGHQGGAPHSPSPSAPPSPSPAT